MKSGVFAGRERSKDGCFRRAGLPQSKEAASLGNRKQLDVMKAHNVGGIMVGMDTRRANQSKWAPNFKFNSNCLWSDHPWFLTREWHDCIGFYFRKKMNTNGNREDHKGGTGGHLNGLEERLVSQIDCQC